MFKEGDTVRLKKLSNLYTQLWLGKHYKVLRVSPKGLVVDNGQDFTYKSDVFELVEPNYKTKPISYEGCHPVIAAHLRNGETIMCRNLNGFEVEIAAFLANRRCKYVCVNGKQYLEAYPLKFINKMKDLQTCFQLLISNGWEMSDTGSWHKDGHSSVSASMLLNWSIDCIYIH